MVIVLLGTLSAVAIPRFSDLGSAAKKSKLQGAYGSVRSSLAVVYAQALIDGKAAASTETIDLSGQSVAIAYGYPQAFSTTGIRGSVDWGGDLVGYGASRDNSQNDWVYQLNLLSGRQVLHVSPGSAVGDAVPSSAANCFIAYKAATAALKAEVEITSSGC